MLRKEVLTRAGVLRSREGEGRACPAARLGSQAGGNQGDLLLAYREARMALGVLRYLEGHLASCVSPA